MRKLLPPSRVLSVAVAVAVVLQAFTGAGIALAAGTTGHVAPDTTGDGPAVDTLDPTFASSAITEQRGDVVRITVRMDEGNSAEVDVLGIDTGYEATVSVTDEDFGGRVKIRFNTFVAGRTARSGPRTNSTTLSS